MGVIAEAVRHMLAAGVDAEAIVSAIEGMESAGSRRAKSDGRATRLARDWWPSKELIDWAAAEGLSAQEINREVLRFRDWSASSPNGAKKDWPAAWRNWVRSVLSRMGSNGSSNTRVALGLQDLRHGERVTHPRLAIVGGSAVETDGGNRGVGGGDLFDLHAGRH